jgi:hypothetical protein
MSKELPSHVLMFRIGAFQSFFQVLITPFRALEELNVDPSDARKVSRVGQTQHISHAYFIAIYH